jgi:fermentation-respiration switch protein FrsA (DUF1100 family)
MFLEQIILPWYVELERLVSKNIIAYTKKPVLSRVVARPVRVWYHGNMMKKISLAILLILVVVITGIGFSYLMTNNSDESTSTNNNPDTNNQSNSSNQNQSESHPFSIDALRNREYPGSTVVIEEELGVRGNYRSYVISYDSDGLKQYALMNEPITPVPQNGFPVLILNHGYIEPTVYDTVTSYQSYMDPYSRAGFLVVKPDYRGHNNSEGEPVSAHTSPDYTVDVLNLVGSIKKYPTANANKIAMWGHSMGGGITLRALAVSKDIKVAALLAGVVASPQSFYNYWQRFASDPRTPSWIKENADRTLNEFGTPDDNPDLWASISPYSYLSSFDAPIQIHHGTADPDVPIVFSDELNAALKDAGQPVEYYIYQGGDHNLAGTARQPVLTRTIDFFNTNLK